MVNKICKHGEQLKLAGGGIYFLCRFDWKEEDEEWRKNSPCRYSRWCKEDKQYYASTDNDGLVCLHFELLRPFSFKKEFVESDEFLEGDRKSYNDEEMLIDLESIFKNYDVDQK